MVEKAEGASLESYSGRGLRKGSRASTTEVLLSSGDGTQELDGTVWQRVGFHLRKCSRMWYLRV